MREPYAGPSHSEVDKVGTSARALIEPSAAEEGEHASRSTEESHE